MRQMYTDDAFKTYDIRDLLQLKKFIVLLTMDLKVKQLSFTAIRTK